MDALEQYERVRAYVDHELVRLTPRPRDPSGKVRAALSFNQRLGDPQRTYPSIQVAGTSGKGTVSSLIAATLQAAGVHTGLHVSPYLQVFTEKTWIDGRYLSPAGLHDALEVVRPVAETFRRDEACPASVHGMTSLALSYEAFRAAQIEAAVMETGCGGRFDLVQGLRRALCVITDLALDHVQALGPTLERIAWHKAGIMEQDVPCVAVEGPGWDVLEREARAVGASLHAVRPHELIREQHVDDAGARVLLDLPHLGAAEVELPVSAPFHIRNATVAAAALDLLAREGWPVRAEHLHQGFALRLPGRFEVVQESPRVVLDGAHNPNKLRALARSLQAGAPLVVVVAATGTRAPTDLLRELTPLAPRVLATEVELHGKAVVPADALAAAARDVGLTAEATAPPEAALDRAIDLAGPDGTVVVTGSIYLIGRLRSRWHPWPQVLLQGTSWPTA